MILVVYLMLALSNVETEAPVCLKDKGENRNWAGRLKQSCFYFYALYSTWGLGSLLTLCGSVREIV